LGKRRTRILIALAVEVFNILTLIPRPRKKSKEKTEKDRHRQSQTEKFEVKMAIKEPISQRVVGQHQPRKPKRGPKNKSRLAFDPCPRPALKKECGLTVAPSLKSWPKAFHIG
jgi:hypothetical protein